MVIGTYKEFASVNAYGLNFSQKEYNKGVSAKPLPMIKTMKKVVTMFGTRAATKAVPAARTIVNIRVSFISSWSTGLSS